MNYNLERIRLQDVEDEKEWKVYTSNIQEGFTKIFDRQVSEPVGKFVC